MLKTVTVTVNPLPTLTLSASTSTLCKGSAVIITGMGATTYTWNTGAKTSTISATPLINTTYTAQGTDANGCIGSNTIGIAIVNPTGSLTVSSNSTICNGASVSITAGGASTYTWSTGENTSNIVSTPSVSMSYVVIATDNVGCNSTKTVNVTVRPVPTINIGSDVEMNLGSSFHFNPTQTLGNTYSWTPSTGLNNPTIINPITTTLNDITYTLTVTALNGCTASDDVNVKLLTDLIFSNYMSPNGDGDNDTWIVNIPLLIKDYKVQIFDSWSKKVFNVDSNYNNEWDAYENPDGVYYYVILEGNVVKFKGSITVTR